MATRRRTASTVQALLGGVFSDLESRARACGGPFFPLHYGDSWFDPADAAYGELKREGRFKYAPPCGEPEFLDTALDRIAAKTGVRRSPEDIVAISGATAGVRDAIQSLVDPGDEVILPAPFWPLVRGTVRARGARTVEVPFFTRLDDADFDPERELMSAVTERTALIYLNTPHNPTGRILSEDVIAAVARVANRFDLWVLADEVYDELYFSDTPPPRTWSRPDLIERTVAVHSMSKAFAMAGARVGWAHGPRDAMDAIRAVHTYQDFGPARSQQLVATRVLKEADKWLPSARARYAEAARMVSDVLKLPPIEGGTFAFAKAPSPCADFLARSADQGVLLTPGKVCGDDFAEWFRLSFTVVQPAVLEQALSIVRGAFQGSATSSL